MGCTFERQKVIAITNAFQKILDESNRKPNKIWVDERSEFYNRSMKSQLQDNEIEMHNKGNKGKSIIAERFIRTLMNKIYKYMTLLAKNVYVNNLADIVKKYNNTYHNTIKMKPVNVKISTYIDFGIENNEKDPKFKVGDHVRISKYKKIFAECYTQNWSEEVFVIKKVKNTVSWTYVISDAKGE